MDIVFLCFNPTSLSAKDFVPVGIAVFVFIANAVYQEFNKRSNIRDRLSSEVISTCDKMIRHAIETEYSVLMMKHWNKVLTFYPLTLNGNQENNKNALNEGTYYHRKAEDLGLKLDLLKSELKKSIKDLQKYWKKKSEVKQIIELMSIVVLLEPRRFENELNKDYSSLKELQKNYHELIGKVQNEVIFEGIGFDLIRIQKIIDPHSPTLLLSSKSEKDLLEKINKAGNTNQIQSNTSEIPKTE